ncbi:uncharacterized protein LOC128092262 [Culex pipiens pallens]|uniref:uncharacterized protein LOC128092262 n=1 Tax=Culex pipiens pallens TaxID=42434 RepID=UPI0019544881|nr:uncharacterized protein LOC128092262 [Culex pipiens pallens]
MAQICRNRDLFSKSMATGRFTSAAGLVWSPSELLTAVFAVVRSLSVAGLFFSCAGTLKTRSMGISSKNRSGIAGFVSSKIYEMSAYVLNARRMRCHLLAMQNGLTKSTNKAGMPHTTSQLNNYNGNSTDSSNRISRPTALFSSSDTDYSIRTAVSIPRDAPISSELSRKHKQAS